MESIVWSIVSTVLFLSIESVEKSMGSIAILIAIANRSLGVTRGTPLGSYLTILDKFEYRRECTKQRQFLGSIVWSIVSTVLLLSIENVEKWDT